MADNFHSNEMTRRDFLGVVAGGAAMVSVSGLMSRCSRIGKKPNIIVVFDDQARSQELGCYGGRNITTPHLDRMAEEGIRFTHATSTCPLCTPYRGMLQTGRYPTHSGVVLNWVNVNPDQRCMAHVFNDAGYDTAFIGKWHLASGARTMNGLHNATQADKRRIRENSRAYVRMNPESEFVPPGPQRLGYAHWEAFNFHVAFNNYWYYKDTSEKLYSGKYETDTQIDQAIAYIQGRQDSDRPFFMMVAPHPPHPPFHMDYSPPGYIEQIKPAEELYWRLNVPEGFPETLDVTKWKPDIVSAIARFYYAMLKNVDDNMGRLLRFLDDAGLSEETIVVFTSDHGEMMGSRGRMNKMVPYAESVSIPLIVRWPGCIRAGSVIDALQAPIDHVPTLCGLAGIQAPDNVDGMDLSEVILGRETDTRDAILMANYVSDWDYCDSGTTWPEWRGIRTKQYTYVKWLDGREELYDDREDPYQMRDLAADNKDLPTLKKMRSRLKDFLAEAHDEFFPGTNYADWYDERRNLLKTGLGKI
jgi:arylsulfatase A-like enzyme